MLRREQPAADSTIDSTAQESGVHDAAASGEGVLIEVCVCGNRMRVPSSWMGRKKKCRRCGAMLIFGSGVVPEESGVRPGLNSELEDELSDLIQKLVAEVEKQSGESALTSQVSSRRLQKFEQQLNVVDPLSRDEAMKRRAAVIELGKTRDARAIAILAQAQHDSWEAVRQGVATALGELADPAALPLALTLLMDSDAEVVRDAMGALRAIGDSRAVPILLLFGQRDATLRLQAREAIVGMGEAAVARLIDVLQGTNSAITRDAVVALGRIRDARAIPPLLNTLDRSTGAVRLSVIEALGRIADPKSVGPLIALLDDPDEQIQIGATTALAQTADSRAVRPLMGILLQTQNVELQKHAIRALAATKDPRGVSAIARLIDHADSSLRETIAEGLGAIGDTAACQPLVRLLRSDNPSILLKAIGALRKVATDDAVEALIPLVQHPNSSIRRQTVEVLGDLRPPDAFDLFAELLTEDVSFEVRSAAAKGLGKLKDRHGIQLLEQALRDEPTVRCAAVMGLTAIGEKQVIPALLATLKDPTPVVRYHAVTGLGKLKAEQATGAIRRLLEDKDSMVRTGAEKALVELGISNPTIPLQRRMALKASRLMPDNLVGVIPGGVATLIAAPCLLVALALVWFVGGSALPEGDLSVARRLAATGEVRDVVWLADSKGAALVRADGSIDVWNPESGEFEQRVKLKNPAAFAFVSSPQATARVLYSLGPTSQLAVWDTTAGAASVENMNWTPFKGRIQTAVASNDGGIFLAVTGATTSVVWDVRERKELATLPFKNRPRPALSGDGKLAAGIVWHIPDPRQPTVGQAILSIYSVETGEKLSEVDPDALPNIQELVFDGSGRKLLAATAEGLVPVTLDEDGFAAVGDAIKAARLRNLTFASDSTLTGVDGSGPQLLELPAGTTKGFQLTPPQGMSIDSFRNSVASGDGSRLLVAGEESKLAWVIDLKSGESKPLDPLQIPESVTIPDKE